MYVLNSSLYFPPLHKATPEGLLAIGGDLSSERLLLAYRSGIFPWFNPGEIIQWWSPNPRFVLFPHKLKISKSMKQLNKQDRFTYRTDTCFDEVMTNCMKIPRPGQDGTWISNEIMLAYKKLYALGFAHSAETLENGNLVGGLYGIKMNSIFFGESMFSLRPNASKFAFIKYVEQLREEGIKIIDCQVYTQHLESLGAEMISREEFEKYLP